MIFTINNKINTLIIPQKSIYKVNHNIENIKNFIIERFDNINIERLLFWYRIIVILLYTLIFYYCLDALYDSSFVIKIIPIPNERKLLFTLIIIAYIITNLFYFLIYGKLYKNETCNLTDIIIFNLIVNYYITKDNYIYDLKLSHIHNNVDVIMYKYIKMDGEIFIFIAGDSHAYNTNVDWVFDVKNTTESVKNKISKYVIEFMTEQDVQKRMSSYSNKLTKMIRKSI